MPVDPGVASIDPGIGIAAGSPRRLIDPELLALSVGEDDGCRRREEELVG